MNWTREKIQALNGKILSKEAPSPYRDYPVQCQNRAGEIIRAFCEPEQVPYLMKLCLTQLNKGLEHIQSFEDLTQALGTFWVGFLITIHPFSDGNRRTAEAVVNQILSHHNLAPINFSTFPQLELTNDFPTDQKNYRDFFAYTLLKKNIKNPSFSEERL